ncbi:ATP-binding cassette domain-containing protein [Bacillus mangrovi]|uniref:ATP-binding cassette domain-containing protein n=1 Tax=Metabacillus mangrovi TaxID=1491830 RepID=A0A7X2S2P8_9BACI|nr:ABC transporter ATP-binding protein [Metabacillus mangrovi]MTH52282.1 ATP-binding cassette domain-containing protein [Metabacillus mangrovi]
MNRIAEVNGLTKSYGKNTAVAGIDFSLEPNKIYGLLGRNGAGKTTVMNMITSRIFPSSGDVRIFGEDPFENRSVLSQICFIKESQKYPDTFNIADLFDICSSAFPNWDQEYADTLIKDFNLPLNRKMKKLSRGMLSAAGIIIGLASRAPLTIFDEPYLGLDAVARNIFYDRLIEDYSSHPRTIILSTHLIDEVSKILEHVLVIDQGKLIMNQEADAIRGKAFTIVGPAAKAAAFTHGREILKHEAIGGFVSVTVMGSLSLEEKQEAAQAGLELAPVSLQQLIIHLTTASAETKEENAR